MVVINVHLFSLCFSQAAKSSCNGSFVDQDPGCVEAAEAIDQVPDSNKLWLFDINNHGSLCILHDLLLFCFCYFYYLKN